MGWQDLLETGEEKVNFPWLGGRELRIESRKWDISGHFPRNMDYGWYAFKVSGRRAYHFVGSKLEAGDPTVLKYPVSGYLVGDRLIPDSIRADLDAAEVIQNSGIVNLIEPGLERFTRITAGRTWERGPLIYKELSFPLGPETEVQEAYLDGKDDIRQVKSVSPSLHVAFWFERWQKLEAERKRAEAERLRREEEEKRIKEERRQQIIKQLGDGAGRRNMATLDFGEAARAALAIGNAELLDYRQSANRYEMVVDFRMDRRRFQCTCDERTLRIIDSGICLTAHWGNELGWEEGTEGHNLFTLESLPSVIREAIRDDKLVVYRRI